ncbi:MAG: hypothetical protein WCX69_03350, partial [Candidatus Paceibacterota bacterium]
MVKKLIKKYGITYGLARLSDSRRPMLSFRSRKTIIVAALNQEDRMNITDKNAIAAIQARRLWIKMGNVFSVNNS